jgi:hypothetical protein
MVSLTTPQVQQGTRNQIRNKMNRETQPPTHHLCSSCLTPSHTLLPTLFVSFGVPVTLVLACGPVLGVVPLVHSGTLITSPTLILFTSLICGFASSSADNVIPNFSFAMIISVSPATTFVVLSVPFTQVAVGSAKGFAVGAVQRESGILMTSPMFIRRGLVICVLTNWI